MSVVFTTVDPVEGVEICVDGAPSRSAVAASIVIFSANFGLVDAFSPSSVEFETLGRSMCLVVVPVFSTLVVAVVEVGSLGSSTLANATVAFSFFSELLDALSPSSVEFEPCGECSPAAVPVLSALAVPVVEVSSLI
jgi:hypothetical protein